MVKTTSASQLISQLLDVLDRIEQAKANPGQVTQIVEEARKRLEQAETAVEEEELE